MPAIIIYSLVLIFFILFPLLVIFFARASEPALQPHKDKAPARQIDKMAYGVLAALFALILTLTVVTHRGQS